MASWGQKALFLSTRRSDSEPYTQERSVGDDESPVLLIFALPHVLAAAKRCAGSRFRLRDSGDPVTWYRVEGDIGSALLSVETLEKRAGFEDEDDTAPQP